MLISHLPLKAAEVAKRIRNDERAGRAEIIIIGKIFVDNYRLDTIKLQI